MSIINVLNSIVLGFGLSMDAFSMALTDGMSEPGLCMKKATMISFTYGAFQMIMPLLGWLGVHSMARNFDWFASLVPWIAFLLLAYIGGDMLKDGIDALGEDGACDYRFLTVSALLVQALATSIDALSVGFTISDFTFGQALTTSFIIGLITFGTCLVGINLGKKIGNKLACKAYILGGGILLVIGIRIFISGILG